MSRDARRVLTELDALANNYGINPIVTQTHAYIADQLTLKYYANAIINAMRSKIKNMRTRASKHFTIDYWVNILDTMFSYNQGVIKNKDVHIDTKGNQTFNDLTDYISADYGAQDAMTINNIIHQFEYPIVYRAIRIARDNNVANINYVNAILSREKTERDMRAQKIRAVGDKAEHSKDILNKQRQEHTVMDMATAQYNWDKAHEDADIEKMFNDLYGGANEDI